MNQKTRQIACVLAATLSLAACTDPGRLTSSTPATQPPTTGAAIPGGDSSFQKQEADLRRSIGSSGYAISNTVDRLIVRIPQDALFASGSAVPLGSAQGDIAAISGSLNRFPASTVQVLAHTDSDGEAAANLSLSEQQATQVRDLMIRSGVAGERILASGRGENQPLTSNLTDEGKMQNRRIEIVILPAAVTSGIS